MAEGEEEGREGDQLFDKHAKRFVFGHGSTSFNPRHG